MIFFNKKSIFVPLKKLKMKNYTLIASVLTARKPLFLMGGGKSYMQNRKPQKAFK